MMDRPTRDELLEAVEHHLTAQLLPKLADADAFYVRVAANMLGIVRRELALTQVSAEAERERLRGLLGEDGDLGTLTRALARAIRDGRIAPDDPALIDHLRRTTLEKLAVDQPRYASYRRAVGGA